MSLMAHAGAGFVNVWGFAYAGGIIGLFSVSLLYVQGRIEEKSQVSGNLSLGRRMVALGPWVIAIGGVCGASLGLGISNLVANQFFDDAELTQVVEQLCERRTAGPSALDDRFHDDLEHVIRDVDARDAELPHLRLHAASASATTTSDDWHRSIDRLLTALEPIGDPGSTTCSRTG